VAHYKILQIVKKDAGDTSKDHNILQYTDTDDVSHEIYIGTQLLLEDLPVKSLYWGANLTLSYCRVVIISWRAYEK
jgi:hypothetical protein